ncbi:MAG: hypothetical protein SFT92_01025 [Rickettsiales bacterium]|nr:hypothetical protein [Rickettsiales bacterium]
MQQEEHREQLTALVSSLKELQQTSLNTSQDITRKAASIFDVGAVIEIAGTFSALG